VEAEQQRPAKEAKSAELPAVPESRVAPASEQEFAVPAWSPRAAYVVCQPESSRPMASV